MHVQLWGDGLQCRGGAGSQACVKASILVVKTQTQTNGSTLGYPPDNAAELIARPDEMKRAFASLGRVTPNKFIQVWDELDRISQHLESWQAAGRMKQIGACGLRFRLWWTLGRDTEGGQWVLSGVFWPPVPQHP